MADRRRIATALRFFSPLVLISWLASCDDGSGPVNPGDCVPALEECNGRDDDCDGTIDEGENGGILQRPCSTICGNGVEECESAQWRYCTAPQPTTEICDGFDNNCDGQVDEGCVCRHGERESCGIDVGVCEPGVRHCEDGQWGQCLLSYDPDSLVEVCNNGLDDDCDGETDEDCTCVPGETQPCGLTEGECQEGLMTCLSDSTWGDECEGAIWPEVEQCNNLDDDCDGEIDYSVASDFGWDTDDQEINDECASGAPIYNASGRAEALEGEDWIEVRVPDVDDLNTYPSLYPPGDQDWYYLRAVEGGRTCVPLTSQCSFVLYFQLQLQDYELAGGDPDDWRLCVTTGDCNETTTGANTHCTHGSDWREEYASYLLSVYWGGSCGRDDSRDVKIQVYSPTEAACGHYRLWTKFEYDDTLECP